MPRTIAVIDGNSLMHRAYHAVPPTMNAPDGTHTNAVFGFLSMLFKFIDTAKPDAIFCAFDVGKPKFRLELMEKYKAQRPPMDQELREQFPVIDDVLGALGIPVVKMPGWEGDDILGSIAAQAEARGWDCLLVTGDKDANQLATLPESLAECDSLETISVVENPLEGGIPRVLLDKKGLSIDQ